MMAALEGKTPIISFLLSAGADVNAINNFGESALSCAALEGECKIIQTLLDAGAAIDVRPHGLSLLTYAGHGGGRFKTQKHFKLLKEKGAV